MPTPFTQSIPAQAVPPRHLLIVFVATLITAALISFIPRDKLMPPSDFYSFHAAAQLAVQGEISPYRHENFQFYAAETGLTDIFPFLYMPQALVVLEPLGFLPRETAQSVFMALSVLATALSAALILVWIGQRTWLYRDWSLYAPVFLIPLFFSFLTGQINFLVLSGLMLCLLSLERRLPASVGGIGLGFAIVLKAYPALFLPYLFLTGRRDLCAYALIPLAALGAAALALYPFEWWKDWLAVTLTGSYGHSPAGLYPAGISGNLSWNGVVSRLFPLGAPQTALLGYGGALALISSTLWRALQPIAPKQLATLLLILIFLIAPLSWGHHFVFLFPALLWLADAAEDAKEKPVSRYLLFSSYAFFGFYLARMFTSDPEVANLPAFALSSGPFFIVLSWWALAMRARKTHDTPKALP